MASTKELIILACMLGNAVENVLHSGYAALDRIVSSVNGYRPVVVMHGILSSYDSMTNMVQFIQKAHPGTEVLNVDAYNDAVR